MPDSPESRPILAPVLEALPDPAVLIDLRGSILASNAPWRAVAAGLEAEQAAALRSGGYFALAADSFAADVGEGEGWVSRFRAWLEKATGEGGAAAPSPAFETEFSTMLEGGRAWFVLKAAPMPGPGGGVLLLHRCVTGLRKAETDLRESHSLFHHVVENLREGIVLYDREGRFVVANTVYAEALGLGVDQLIGRTFFEVLKPDLAKTLQEQNLLVLTTGQTFHFELPVETARGIRHLNTTKLVYRNHRNEVAGVLCVIRDVSSHRRAEKTLEKSERHFRALIENSADRVTLLGPDGTIRYASPSTKRILGFELDEMHGSDLFLWVHPQDHALMRRRFRELVEHPGGSITGQYRALRKDGGWLWMEATATNLLDDPSVGAIVVNERDISERKQTESELRRFANIIESSNDAIISASPEGAIISWNPAAERIFGGSEAERLTQSIDLLIPSAWRKPFNELRNAALRKKGSNEVETILLHKSGRRINVSLTLSPIHDRDGQITGFSMTVRDITERRRLEKEILEISDREKQRIGQDLHDDLCQHLVGISLISNALYEELEQLGLKQAEDARHVLELVRHSIDHARILARGLSPLNLVDTGFLTSLERLVSSTEQLFRVRCAFECGEPFFVKNGAAAIHLYRIAQEALHNAVKHSCASRVVVSAGLSGDVIAVSIKDDGVGFAPGDDRLGESEGLGGFGMHTMRYRATIIGATLEFCSIPEGGTEVLCRVPKQKLDR